MNLFQALDLSEQSEFMVKRSGELLCTITMNENGISECDNCVSENELSEIIEWIEKLFL